MKQGAQQNFPLTKFGVPSLKNIIKILLQEGTPTNFLQRRDTKQYLLKQ